METNSTFVPSPSGQENRIYRSAWVSTYNQLFKLNPYQHPVRAAQETGASMRELFQHAVNSKATYATQTL